MFVRSIAALLVVLVAVLVCAIAFEDSSISSSLFRIKPREPSGSMSW